MKPMSALKILSGGAMLFLVMCTQKEGSTLEVVINRGNAFVSGYVEPVVTGTNVRLIQGRDTTKTTIDATGLFSIADVALGRYVLQVTAPGFGRYESSWQFSDAGEYFLDYIKLATVPYPLSSVSANQFTSTNVIGSTLFALNFLRAMDSAATVGAISLTPLVKGHYVWNSQKTYVSYVVDKIDSFASSYRLSLGIGMRTVSGIALEFPYEQVIPGLEAKVTQISPTNFSAGYALTSPVSLTFNIPMSPIIKTGAIVVSPATPLDIQVSGTRIDIRPATGSWGVSTTCTLSVVDTLYSLSRKESFISYQTIFTTEGARVSTVSPGNGSTYNSTNQSIMVRFNTAVNMPSAQAAFSLTDTAGVRVSGTITWYNSDELRFTPTSILKEGSKYFVVIDTTAYATNNTKVQRFVSSFVTSSASASTSSSGSYSNQPLDGDVNVPLNQYIVLNFPSSIGLAAIRNNFVCKDSTGSDAGGYIGSSGSTYLYYYPRPLKINIRYQVLVAGATDTFFNFSFRTPTFGIDSTSYDFTPVFTDLKAPFRIKFNSNPSNLTAIPSLSFTPAEEMAITVNSTSNLISILPFSGYWHADSQYTVSVNPAILKDVAGNALIDSKTTFTFKTGSVSVIDHLPLNGSIRKTLNTTISIFFNTLIDTAAVRAALTVKDTANNSVSGSLTWDSPRTSVTFIPTSSLIPRMTYRVRVAPSAADIFGATLKNSFDYSFTTGD